MAEYKGASEDTAMQYTKGALTVWWQILLWKLKCKISTLELNTERVAQFPLNSVSASSCSSPTESYC